MTYSGHCYVYPYTLEDEIYDEVEAEFSYVEPECWADLLKEIKSPRENYLHFQNQVFFSENVVPLIKRSARRMRRKREGRWYFLYLM